MHVPEDNNIILRPKAAVVPIYPLYSAVWRLVSKWKIANVANFRLQDSKSDTSSDTSYFGD